MLNRIEGKDHLRSRDESVVELQFLHRPENIHAGRRIILREGLAKCNNFFSAPIHACVCVILFVVIFLDSLPLFFFFKMS